MIDLTGLTPAAEQGWLVLFELAAETTEDWLLVGGQMMLLLAAEEEAVLPRSTNDLDVVVDVRSRPDGTQWLAHWLQRRDFELEGASTDGIGHRFVRVADPGPGRVAFDVLATEGVGPRATVLTVPPFRTVQAPGSTQALTRSEVVDVGVTGLLSGRRSTGRVRRPGLLGALVIKAAALTEMASRTDPARDWQDASLLLSMIPDPVAVAQLCTRRDRRRLHGLTPLLDRSHVGWATLTEEDYRRGAVTLDFLLGR